MEAKKIKEQATLLTNSLTEYDKLVNEINTSFDEIAAIVKSDDSNLNSVILGYKNLLLELGKKLNTKYTELAGIMSAYYNKSVANEEEAAGQVNQTSSELNDILSILNGIK